MKRRNRKTPVFFVTFGIGMIVAFYCPLKVLVLLLSIVVIYLGTCCLKC